MLEQYEESDGFVEPSGGLEGARDGDQVEKRGDYRGGVVELDRD
jgi:hypothetical protein